ncbi:MAG: hypothetical protein SOW80_03530 [Anaerovoracaceae bacterium]|nr:hypothetical protein [Anaerovoracaceae bacterium]
MELSRKICTCGDRECPFNPANQDRTGYTYVEDLPGSIDTCLLEADGEEGIFFGKLDLELLRDYRMHEVHGNAYRRLSK